LTTKAARVGFDWQRVEDIFDKLHEEIDELKAAIRERDAGNRSSSSEPINIEASEQLRRESPSRPASGEEAMHERVREELGDLLFAATNIARHLGVEPEAALKLTNRKFRRRFRHIERGLSARGRALEAATLEEMEELWQEAKVSDK
jgi:ATP diphosphatase